MDGLPAESPPFPIASTPWRWNMGLRPLDLAHWLEVDRWRSRDLAAKRRALAEDRPVVLAATQGSGRSTEELLEEVVANMDHHHPGVLAAGGGRLVDLASGALVDDPDPLARAALVVQEDLCLLEPRGEAWTLVAACVCFPSRWSLADKIGNSVDEIHRPVPRHEAIARPVGRFFDRLAVDRPVWRLNWSVLETSDLSLPSAEARTSPASSSGVEDLWFRVERQTLRRLPRTGAIAFTIRTFVDRLVDVLDGHLERRRALQLALATVDDETSEYKGWREIRPALLAWLEGSEPSS